MIGAAGCSMRHVLEDIFDRRSGPAVPNAAHCEDRNERGHVIEPPRACVATYSREFHCSRVGEGCLIRRADTTEEAGTNCVDAHQPSQAQRIVSALIVQFLPP